jgi:hypothetical protein
MRSNIGINAGAQIEIKSTGIRDAAGGIGGLSGNSTGATRLGQMPGMARIPRRIRTRAHCCRRCGVPASILLAPTHPVPVEALACNSPSGSNFSTAGESPRAPSASVTNRLWRTIALIRPGRQVKNGCHLQLLFTAQAKAFPLRRREGDWSCSLSLSLAKAYVRPRCLH